MTLYYNCALPNPTPYLSLYRSLIYTQPHLRASVSVTGPSASWERATDFSDTFVFEEIQEGAGLEAVWDRVVKEANRKWDFNSGKPLYR